ncbi:MAG: PilZ domain-containing protein [Hyphomonadaceae bacterium]|nr:PilZ domain-containing protein [Hyphomonadaceae bacterium]
MGWLNGKKAIVSTGRIESVVRRPSAAEVGFGQNRRRSERIECSGVGEIVLPRGNRVKVSSIDISETGARIRLSSGNRLPLKFHLILPAQGVDEPVMLAWQSTFEAGVYFA